MSELPASDTHDVIHHGGAVVAVVLPIAEYQQLRRVAEEQRVNEDFDIARTEYLAAGTLGRSATFRMRKRAGDLALLPGELPGQLGDPGSRPGSGLRRRRSTGVAALWGSVSRLAEEPRPAESFATVRRTCGGCAPTGTASSTRSTKTGG